MTEHCNTGCTIREHQVQFYDSEAFLLDRIWTFIRPALERNEGVIVIATPAHLDMLKGQYALCRQYAGARQEGLSQYIALDARQTLSHIMVDDWPDAVRFKTHIGELIRRVSKDRSQPVYAFGEMVALLCADGKRRAAIRLEQLWTELLEEYPVSLLCAYPMGAFASEEDRDAFQEICDSHTHVRPCESFHAGSGEEDLRRMIAVLQQKANALESEVARRKEIERALQARERELSDIDRRKDEFLAMLGHELRNPLAPIMNALELMRIYGDDPVRIARLRETIARQVTLMTRLVGDLLDVSRITRGRIELKMDWIQLDCIIEEAVEIARPLIDERRHHLSMNLPAGHVSLWGDSARLAQVLANLLHNAAKYTEPGGSISISATEENGKLILVVSDNGIGIDEELREKIFEMFVQDANSLGKARGGLGLGLTLVRSLVHMHEGSVEARSNRDGKGSEFVVTLPLHQKGPVTTAEQNRALAVVSDTPSRKILIVDDNIDAAESLAEFLKAAGHRIQVAHDGSAAIREAARVRPDVIILDIGLPSMDGYQVARRLRSELELTSSLLIAVTGYAQERDRLSAQMAGFDHHLAKPLDITRLTALLGTPGQLSQ
jgi:signal transduction histidine kinase